ncbi:MAG: DnaJ domain-containing protein [Archangium sp.]|nr:DnaJ domain-containing protein [Archangium sp.]
MPQAATACTTLEDVDVECTQCGVRMSSHVGSSRQIRYFHCPSCSRWTTSMYSEVLRADTKMRARRPAAAVPASTIGSVKDRLENWLLSLSGKDPYRTLGVIPSISDVGLRERYLALARTHHPDKGGSAEDMRRINEAYEQALAHRAQNRTPMHTPGLPLASR